MKYTMKFNLPILALMVLGFHSFLWSQSSQLEGLEEISCYECHDSELDQFRNTSHHLLVMEQKTTDLESSCKACHGDPEEHIEDPTLTNILSSKHTPKEMSETCLTCHKDAGRSQLLALNGHATSNISTCVDCHSSGHYEEKATPLLLREPKELCSSCHQAERAQFEMPFAHKDMDGPMACTACHDVHDSSKLFSLTQYGSSQLCTSCHKEKEGPYLYPHAVNEIEACIACHSPHGSLTPFQLKRPTSTQLCMECHTDYFLTHRDPTLGLQSCVQCHAEIHGSQSDHLFYQP